MEKKDIDILKEALQGAMGDKFDLTTNELYARFKDICDKYGVIPNSYPMFIELVRNFKTGNTALTISKSGLVEIKKFCKKRYNECLQKSTAISDIYCPINSSLLKTQCAHCSGLLDKKEEERRKYKEEQEAFKQYTIRKAVLQRETEALAENHDKLWTDEELSYVIVNTHNHDKRELEVLYRIAIHLKRTLASIEWIYIKIWEEENRKLFETERNILERIDTLKEKFGV